MDIGDVGKYRYVFVSLKYFFVACYGGIRCSGTTQTAYDSGSWSSGCITVYFLRWAANVSMKPVSSVVGVEEYETVPETSLSVY